jgi:hypothetical protein
MRARGICVVIDNDADNLYITITITTKAMNPKLKIFTRAGQERYAQAMRTSGTDEVIIPEYEGGKLARSSKSTPPPPINPKFFVGARHAVPAPQLAPHIGRFPTFLS